MKCMNNFNTIQEFINFVESQKRLVEKNTLDTMFQYCDIIGNPQNSFKSVHVTGTNGKGSVVAYLKNIFMEHGFRVGTFTSPYITKFNERICINNQQISDDDVLKHANFIISKYPEFLERTGRTPSFFEFITLLSFLYFEKSKPDIVIVEVGIGGLLDSTNVINPLSSVITNVSYDHMNILGDTLEEILMNKLGIVKKSKPLIVGIKDKNLLDIVERTTKDLDCHFYAPLLGAFEIIKSDLLSNEFILEELGLIKLNLSGFFQIENAIVAVKTFKITMTELGLTEQIDNIKIKQGLSNTTWPGRLEKMSENPLVLIDGGHNIDGIKRVCEFIDKLNYSRKRCIFACSDNKEKEKMIQYLEPYFDQIIITSFTYKRHSSAKELFNYSKHSNKLLMNDIDEIISFVEKNPYELNLYLGSLYFVSEIRPKLKKESTI